MSARFQVAREFVKVLRVPDVMSLPIARDMAQFPGDAEARHAQQLIDWFNHTHANVAAVGDRVLAEIEGMAKAMGLEGVTARLARAWRPLHGDVDPRQHWAIVADIDFPDAVQWCSYAELPEPLTQANWDGDGA